MSAHIHINASLDRKPGVTNNSVHYMPCQIHADGEANISKYFKPYIKMQDGNGDGMWRKPASSASNWL
jgi:hypothetical protein